MVIQEVHTNINLGIDKIYSKQYDWITPREIDTVINKNVYRFIKTRYEPLLNQQKAGFQMSQKRIDDLRLLEVPYYTDYCFTTEETDRLRFYLPSDYMWLTSQRSYIYGSPCKTITYTNSGISSTIYTIPIDFSEFGGNAFTDFDIIRNDTSASIINSTVSAQFNLYDEDLTQLFLDDLVAGLSSSDFTAGWEVLNGTGVFGDNLLIIKYTGGGTAPTLSYKYVGVTYDFTVASSAVSNTRLAGDSNGEYITNPNRYAQMNDVWVMQKDPFNKSNLNLPLTIVYDNAIDVLVDLNKFIVEKLIISYIRKPKQVSLELNQGIELPDHTHPEIVQMCVDDILEMIESRRLNTAVELNKDLTN